MSVVGIIKGDWLVPSPTSLFSPEVIPSINLPIPKPLPSPDINLYTGLHKNKINTTKIIKIILNKFMDEYFIV